MSDKKELTNEELENVAGGCGGTYSHCRFCDEDKGGDWWKATYTDPTTKQKTRYSMCLDCANERFHNPDYSNWEFWTDHK